MSVPSISISLQTFNRGNSGYLKLALEAILSQSYSDFELFVIDNHSTDNTAKIVLEYTDPRLTYIRLPPGGTPLDSIRMAFRVSRGTYLLTTHDDDVMEPMMLEKQVDCIRRHPELAALATNVSLINEHGEKIQDKLYEMESDRLFGLGSYIKTYFEEKLWFPTPTMLFKRDAVLERERSFISETKGEYLPSGDIAGLFKLNSYFSVGILAEPLLRYRQHSGQESRKVNQTAPLVALAKFSKKLLEENKSIVQLQALLPTIQAFSTRYQAQEALFHMVGKQLEQRLLVLKEHWEELVGPKDRGLDVAIPFEILLAERGYELTIPKEMINKLEKQPVKGGSQLAYRQWAQLIHRGGSLLHDFPELQRIVILGSMFTAFLIVQSAYKCGVEVICCLDSSSERIGDNVLGVPILGHNQLRKIEHQFDAVILSSERDHEESLRNILQKNNQGTKLDIYSWKELLANSSNKL